MSAADIQAAINKLPQLTSFGYGLAHQEEGMSKLEYKEAIQKAQMKLLADTESFDKACLWLKNIKPMSSMNNKHTSYGLKHLAEKEIGYITNGTFIAAAIHCGFKYKVRKGSPNVKFNMAEDSLATKL